MQWIIEDAESVWGVYLIYPPKVFRKEVKM
jgi:hypothetical protein